MPGAAGEAPTSMPIRRIVPSTRAGHLRVGIVLSRFNPAIGDALLTGAQRALAEAGVADSSITIATVPGALEAPLALQRMAQTGDYDALVALGAVIRGDTYHFEIVANESAAGLASVQLEFGIPIGNGILTTDTEAQAAARAEGKGQDAALAALEMANLLDSIDEQ
jgi:6,7-dimethyl-8-ribityllumazine synthase